jgi:hypothetical protein
MTTRAEYEKMASDFRLMLKEEALKGFGNQNFPEDDEWLKVSARVYCSTDSCPGNNGVSILIGENADGVYRAHCGDCHTDHTTIVLVYDDEEVVVISPEQEG